MNEKLTDPVKIADDNAFDASLRPQSLEEFVGQRKLKEQLSIAIQATRERNEALEHVLFYGPPGLGKTTLAAILSKELDVEITTTSGPILMKPADLAGSLTALNERDILFVDEIHRMNRVVEEYLYPAMEDFTLDIALDQGPGARSVRVDLCRFTLVGATTRAGMITSPMRDRFGITLWLDYYSPKDLLVIVLRSAGILGVEIDDEGALEIAGRSRGTPRIANRLLRRVRDYAQVKGDGAVNQMIARKALAMLEVDEKGLDDMDKRIVMTIAEKFGGGPVGIKTLAMAVGEEAETIEELYEPYLVKEGFINKTPRGREITAIAREHFGIRKAAKKQTGLF